MARMQEMSAIERLRQLDAERARIDAERDTIRTQAAEDLLASARSILADINALGFSYELVQRGSSRSANGAEPSRKGTRQVNPSRPCPICGFATVPPHDARRHRGQNPKGPFTAEELSAAGMSRA